MRMFWQFIVSVVANFIFLVSGSILALYYVFAAPYLPNSATKTFLDTSLPLLCFFIACYMAWRQQQLTIHELQNILEEQGSKKPLYQLEVIEDLNIVKSRIEEVEGKIKSAKVSKTNAPMIHPYLGSLGMGEPSADNWQDYIDELIVYKAFLQSLVNEEEYRIINFTLRNSGYVDTNINVDLHFNGFIQQVDFYNEEIEHGEPREPSLSLIPVTIGAINKLGNRKEVQTDEPDQIIIEIDRIRHDDTIRLHHNPIFIKKTGGEQKVEYSIKSDGLTNTDIGTVSL